MMKSFENFFAVFREECIKCLFYLDLSPKFCIVIYIHMYNSPSFTEKQRSDFLIHRFILIESIEVE